MQDFAIKCRPLLYAGLVMPIFKGLLAQLVQSAALTEQRSLVRAQYSPLFLPCLSFKFLTFLNIYIIINNLFGNRTSKELSRYAQYALSYALRPVKLIVDPNP